MRQLLWLYVRAWLWAQWTRLPAWPRVPGAFWAWLALGALSVLSLKFKAELWPHTPAAATCAFAGLALAGAAGSWLLLRGCGQWLAALGRYCVGGRRGPWVGLLVLAGGAALAVLVGVGIVGALGLGILMLNWR